MAQNKPIFLIISLLLFLSCASTTENISRPEVAITDDNKATELLKIIKNINDSSPSTISSSFTANGDTKGKKFNIEGKMAFNRGEYYISFSDFIFKSKIVDIYRDSDKLFFHYPTEKKLLIDDVNKIELYNYTGLRTEFEFVEYLFSGKIPLLKNYSISKTLKEDEEAFYLILENEEYFENIYIKKNLPEKILVIHKKTKEKTEIHLSSLMQKDKSIFYKKIKISCPSINLAVNINFINTKLNEPVAVSKPDISKLKKTAEIIKIN